MGASFDRSLIHHHTFRLNNTNIYLSKNGLEESFIQVGYYLDMDRKYISYQQVIDTIKESL
jgi:hypothetical protein